MGEQKTWTIMLFIEADGALANFAVGSLKQLAKSLSKRNADDGRPDLGIVAQFAFPFDPGTATSAGAKTSGDENRRRFIFRQGIGMNLAAHQVPFPAVPKKADMSGKSTGPDNANGSETEALKEFLRSVHAKTELERTNPYALEKTDHYALVLWGHGPELLLQPGAGNPSDSRDTMYITPEQLRDALIEWNGLPGNHRLEIVGFDACYMSMLEMACELQGQADYMVASQDEVPDQSFPYDDLIDLFLDYGDNTKLLLTEGVKEYVRTYHDYIFDQDTGLNPVTLSALSLTNCDVLKGAVRSLVCELLKAKDIEGLADLLIEARKASEDYAGGLYVDLHGFCTNLSDQLNEKKDNDARKAEIRKAINEKADIQTKCADVLNALKVSGDGKSIILANGSAVSPKDMRGQKPSIIQVNGLEINPKNGKPETTSVPPDRIKSHGISIYLPYFTVDQFNKVNQPLVKGNQPTHGGKGLGDMLNGAAIEYLMRSRRELILATERDYKDLELAKATNWYSFITEVWTKALIETDPVNLDFHYSAQQSWVNRLRNPIGIAEACKPREPKPND